MHLLNFSHPLTPQQKRAIEKMVGQPVTAVYDQMFQFDPNLSLAEQVANHLNLVPLFSDEWQTHPLLVNLPGFAPASAVLLAQIHGRVGHFPAIIRLRPMQGTAVTSFELAEIINLQAIRDHARTSR